MSRLDRIVCRATPEIVDDVKYMPNGDAVVVGRRWTGTGGRWWRLRFADLVERRRTQAARVAQAVRLLREGTPPPMVAHELMQRGKVRRHVAMRDVEIAHRQLTKAMATTHRGLTRAERTVLEVAP